VPARAERGSSRLAQPVSPFLARCDVASQVRDGGALQFRLQARGLGIPYPVFLMFPYVVTLAVLAFAAGGGRAPADLGRPYAREAREAG
jgi:hypothetical protein